MADKTPATGERKAARADVVPSSLNEEARTIEIVFATETPVRRRTWDGVFHEVLSLNPKHVRMARFQSGRAPFLNEHRSWSSDAHVGVIESARIENGKGVAIVRFLKDDPDADKVWGKIRQGVLRSISVGYTVHRFVKIEGGDEKVPVFRAEDWEPLEASAVAVPADPESHIRSMAERNSMDPENKTPEQTDTQAERERASTILELCKRHNLQELGAELVRNGMPLADARALVLDKVATRSEADGPNPWPSGAVERGHETPGQRGGHDDFHAAAVDALVMRSGIQVAKPHPAAGDLKHMPALEMARTALSRAGKRLGNASPGEIIKRAMTTSDFPQILTGAIGASVRQGYTVEPASHVLWVGRDTVPDFREQLRPILGSAPDLEPVAELAEYTFGSMSEDSTSYRVTKYGKALALSWELLVNDRLAAFLRVQPALGQAARRKEADLIYGLFKENSGAGPTMQDSIPLFHTDHANTVTGGLDVAGFGKARTALRKQTAVGGGYLALVPRYVIIPADYETDLDVLLASTTRTKSTTQENDTPDWVQRLVPVVEPRLSTGAYYLAADSSQIDTFVLALLDENAGGPVIEEDTEFNRDAHRMKVRHVAGAKALDWRGLIRVQIG